MDLSIQHICRGPYHREEHQDHEGEVWCQGELIHSDGDVNADSLQKIGAVGYCFGAKYVVRFLKPGQVDVGYCAHPSFVEDKELEAIKGPLAISAAETDHIFPTEKRHKSEEILKEVKQPYQINLYSGVEHGFAVRGDPKVRQTVYAKESAFLQALQWFEEHLK